MSHFVRAGDCPPERCQGRCCKQTGFWFDPTPVNEEFLYLQQVRGATVKEVGEKYLLLMDQVCQFLRQDGLCGLHPSVRKKDDELPERPDFCERWPEEPAQVALFPGCGYYFAECDCTDGRHEKIAQGTLQRSE